MPNFPWTQTLSPYLLVRSVEESYAYYTRVLGFLPGNTMPGPDGKWGHAELTLGSVVIMLGRIDGYSDTPKAEAERLSNAAKAGHLGAGVNLYVNLGLASVDAHYKGVKERGGKVLDEPTTMFWGDRMYRVVDTDGYVLTFAQTVADFDPSKIPANK